MNRYRLKILLASLPLFIFAIVLSPSAFAYQNPPKPSLIPIGSGDATTYEGLVLAAKTNLVQGTVRILILPIAEASNPEDISIPERTAIVQKSERIRLAIQDTCDRLLPETIPCEVILAPIITRSDAVLPTTYELLDQSYSVILISGADPKVAIQVIGGTSVDQKLNEAYQRGVNISSLEGSHNLLSVAMIGGLNPQFSTQDTLRFGTVNVWNSSEEHGLIFGLKDAVIDHNLYFADNFGRLLNAIALPDTPNVGIGTEINTGLQIENNLNLQAVFGTNNITILDGETHYSSAAVNYVGCEAELECYPVISLRNVLVHMIAPGKGSFDLETRQHSLAALDDNLVRQFEILTIPEKAGPLFLASNFSPPFEQNAIFKRFLSLSGDIDSRYVLFIAGGEDDSTVQDLTAKYQSSLGSNLEVRIIPPEIAHPELNMDQVNGIIIEAVSGATLSSSAFDPVYSAWQSGIPILAAGDAAKQLGRFFIADTPKTILGTGQSPEIISSLHADQADLKIGLGWLDVSLQDNILTDKHMSDLFALAYYQPEQLAIGLTRDSALLLQDSGAEVVGSNAVASLDLSQAILDVGDNGAFVIANGYLDIFAPGEKIEPGTVTNLPLSPLATPLIQTLTATSSPTLTNTPPASPTLSPTPPPPTLTPTKTKRPTATPLPVPPPSDPKSLQWIVAFGVLIVVVILFGILINRQRL